MALAAIMIMMSVLWIISVFARNVSIVDIFWGFGFVVCSVVYYVIADGDPGRKLITLVLSSAWGLRLSTYLAWRNHGKGEDFRYREFRKKYGEKRYWWVSFFQTFMLQGILMWIISLPLIGSQFTAGNRPGLLDYAGILVWLTGFIFEAGGDWQLARFRSDPANKGKVLDSGFWKYTRHPNYFGDSAVWWGFGLLSIAGGNWFGAFGSVIMTALIIKVSGVALLEKSLVNTKPQYREYVRKTNSFFPWFPRK